MSHFIFCQGLLSKQHLKYVQLEFCVNMLDTLSFAVKCLMKSV